MEWENIVVKLEVKSKDIDFNSPLNTFKTENSSGTGFFITKKLILTCYHVVKYAINITAYYKQNDTFNAKLKHIFPDDDLAIIELEKEINDCKVLDFKVINKKQIGDVRTIGFPLGSTNIKVTQGIISGFQGSLIQTDASINPGNSGGPLVIEHNNKHFIIGINVSKLTGNAEGTSYVVPIYRFIILQKLIIKDNSPTVIKKPLLLFNFQKLIQKALREVIFSKHPKILKNNSGIMITKINEKFYLNRHFKENEIILSINMNPVDLYGMIKFDFYPEKIPIHEIGLWFIPGEKIKVEILNQMTNEIRIEEIELKVIKTNLLDYWGLENYPSYFVENNGLIFSIITKEHMKNIKDLNINEQNHLLRILNNYINMNDIFTVYLADIDDSKIKNFIKYPIGSIITKINNKTFNNYEEFIEVIKEPVTIIKTFDNMIYKVDNMQSTNKLQKEFNSNGKRYYIKYVKK